MFTVRFLRRPHYAFRYIRLLTAGLEFGFTFRVRIFLRESRPMFTVRFLRRPHYAFRYIRLLTAGLEV